MANYKNAYKDNHVDFEISSIRYENDFEKSSLSEEDSELRTLKKQIQSLKEKEEERDVDFSAAIAQVKQEIEDITGDYESTPRASIAFTYSAPAISVDSSARFNTQKIIGGSTVRQKIGEDPLEIKINGVCKESVAIRLDTLRDAKSAILLSNRFSGGSVEVQFASVSTSPLDDGGAVAMTGDEFLYTYTISAVEITV